MPHPSTNSFNDQPVVILGAARSGTKLLRALVAATGRYAEVPYDVNYIWRFGNESCPHDALPVECLTDRTRTFVRGRLRRCAKMPTGSTPLVEKTVSNVLRVPFVKAVFPDAKYIAIVRDGRDVVESAERCWRKPPGVGDVLRKLRTFPWLQCAPYGWKYGASAARRCLHLDKHLRTWGPRYAGIDDDVCRLSLVEVCARQWLASIEHYERSRCLFSTDQLLELRYEELVGDPPAQVRRICGFLGVADDTAACRHARRVVRADRIGTHTNMTEDDRQKALAIIGGALGRWGYVDRPATHVAA